MKEKKGIIKEFGELLGIGGFIKSVEKLPLFKERFKEVEMEIERKLKGHKREFQSDVFDEKDHILVIGEIPGVDESTIEVTLDGGVLAISCDKGDMAFYKEFSLPESATGKPLVTYKNGILEVRVEKTSLGGI